MRQTMMIRVALLAVPLALLAPAVTPTAWAQDDGDNPELIDVAGTLEKIAAQLQDAPMGYRTSVTHERALLAQHDTLPSLVAVVGEDALLVTTVLPKPEGLDHAGLLEMCNALNQSARFARYYADDDDDIMGEFGTFINGELDDGTFGMNVWQFVKEIMAVLETPELPEE